MKRLQDQKGFTLIEILIAVIILGLVIGSYVSYFGNPLSSTTAATSAEKIIDNEREINDISQNYTLNNGGAELGSLAGYTVPAAPSGAMDPAFTGTYAYTLVPSNSATYAGWSTSADDTVVKLAGVTLAVCQKINNMQNGAAAGATPAVTLSFTNIIQCWNNGGTAAAGTGPYEVVYVIYQN